ncbi:MAG: hypothetical protein IT319_03785 [Anaerolineae bacterium]|nr:hypothetical protein [Anaerolineae bacterium]
MQQAEFAQRVRERFPEGLTGIFAIGGTRTTFILTHNRDRQDPGKIADFTDYGTALSASYLDFIQMFLDLGGSNLIIPVLGYQRFSDKGEEYAQAMVRLCLWLTNDTFCDFYVQQRIDPYFAGIDILLHLPEEHVGHHLAAKLTDFQAKWDYQPDRRKVVWEIAPIPLYSIWKTPEVLGENAQAELAARIAETTDLGALDQVLYEYYSRALYGTYIPMPHFYVGSNRKQALKLRTMLPMALYSGVPLRFYYTPYPSLMMTKETMQIIIDDLAFGGSLASVNKDYAGTYTPESAEAEYQRMQKLAADPYTTLGLVRTDKS